VENLAFRAVRCPGEPARCTMPDKIFYNQ
jgi:hypothetical protein